MAVNHADIRVPRECREMIRAGALVAVNTSGGKDSQSMTILLSRIIPRDQIVAVHAPLVDVEWPGTVEFIRATLPSGIPLILAPVTSGKTLLDSIEERGRFPSPKVRWCTSSLKRGPIERELRRLLKANPRFGGRLVNGMGMSRLSCVFCIMASRADLRTAARLQPAFYARYVALEKRIGHTLSPSGRSLPELTGIPVPSDDFHDTPPTLQARLRRAPLRME